MLIPHNTTSDSGDFYEYVLRDTQIVRITRYANGTQKRSDMQYDECPEEVKNTILNSVIAVMNENRE